MVGFRYFVLGHAERLGLTGWVRNGSDGQTVEIVAEGDEGALNELEAILRKGPPASRVDSIDSSRTEKPQGFPEFTVRA